MSKVTRDAYHAARLLQNELTRLGAKRERSISNANAAFQLDLREAVVGVKPSTLQLVRQVLREDVSQRHLSLSLETLLDTVGIAGAIGGEENDVHERPTDAPEALALTDQVETRPSSLPPPPPSGPDGNEAWGMSPALAGALDVPGDSVEGDLPVGYRYPEPGEPATQLPDGTVVALEGSAA